MRFSRHTHKQNLQKFSPSQLTYNPKPAHYGRGEGTTSCIEPAGVYSLVAISEGGLLHACSFGSWRGVGSEDAMHPALGTILLPRLGLREGFRRGAHGRFDRFGDSLSGPLGLDHRETVGFVHELRRTWDSRKFAHHFTT